MTTFTRIPMSPFDDVFGVFGLSFFIGVAIAALWIATHLNVPVTLKTYGIPAAIIFAGAVLGFAFQLSVPTAVEVDASGVRVQYRNGKTLTIAREDFYRAHKFASQPAGNFFIAYRDGDRDRTIVIGRSVRSYAQFRDQDGVYHNDEDVCDIINAVFGVDAMVEV